MRTRIYNKMIGQEVEAYLARGGKTIYVALGVTEVHGAMPIDCESTLAEAAALAFAEETDGLAMVNLPYFFPGGTVISNATVQVSVQDSIRWLMTICRSLVSQGFDKIFLVSAHGPADLYANAMCRDFFQETKVHVCHISLLGPLMKLLGDKGIGFFDTLIYGAYKMMGQLDAVPLDPQRPAIRPEPVQPDSAMGRLQQALAAVGAKGSVYFDVPEQHFGGSFFKTPEERLAACTEGEQAIRALAAGMAPDLRRLQEALDAYHAHVREVLERYPHAR